MLVTATDGDQGLAARDHLQGLGARRLTELQRAADALGVAKVINLGYPDSGFPEVSADPAVFARRDPDEVAPRLAEILRAERADALTSYDPLGGYGHADHRQVHLVARRAARLAGVGTVLEATVDRRLIAAAVRLGSLVPGLLDPNSAAVLRGSFTPAGRLTHHVNVRPWLDAKRAALAAHASQAGADGAPRTVSLLLRLPAPLFSLVLGTEWFVDRTLSPGRRDDPLESVNLR